MSVTEYINRHNILLNTPFKITSDGKGYFIEGDRMYTREQFIRRYPLPINLVTHNKPNFDSTQNFLHID